MRQINHYERMVKNMVQHLVGLNNTNTAYWDEYAAGIISALGLKQIFTKGEWHGPCPNCGGKDRFWIKEYQGEVRLNCRQCDDFKAISNALRDMKLLPEFVPDKKEQKVELKTPFPVIETDNEYLKRKKILLHGAKIDGPDLHVPIQNNKGQIVGHQFIEPDGTKKFNHGLKPKGCFHIVGGPIQNFCFLAEGFATAASVHQATNKPCVHGLSANNLCDVVEAIREKKPDVQIIIAGDNDPAGRKACEKASDQLGVTYVLPKGEGLDWNDVYLARGPEYTRKALEPTSVLDQVVFPDETTISTKANYIVKNWISDDSMSIVFGPSNVGKTFFCQDLAWHVAANQPWLGNKVKGGPVLYLQTEGGLSWQARIAALREKYPDHKDVRLAIRAAPINLFNSEEDIQTVKAILEEMARKYGPVRMLVVDTISRATQGQLDENSNTDAAQFIANLDQLKKDTGVHVMLVGHSGKGHTTGKANGLRGASAFRAASDTEIELSIDEDNGVRTATTTKQRDMETGREFNFILEPRQMGVDDDGDAITTCTIRTATKDEVAEKKRGKVSGPNQKLLKEAYLQLRGENVGGPNPAGAGWPEPRTFWVIDEATLRDHFLGKKAGAANPTTLWKQTTNSLLNNGLIAMNNGQMWFTDKTGRCSNE